MRIVLALALIFGAAAVEADACSIIVPWHEVDAAQRSTDTSAPEPPRVEVESIRRGHGPTRGEGGAIVATSCDDIGFITLKLQEPGVDDRTPAAELGYIVRVVEGETPEDLVPSARAIRAGESGLLTLHWIDGATDEQEPLDFTVEIVPVDSAGNEGPPSEPLRIRTGCDS